MMKFLHLPSLFLANRNLLTLFCCVLFLCLVPQACADTTVGGTISTDTSWTVSGSPYIVTSNINVQDADGITTLTIEPGAVIRFNSNLYMNIGSSSGDQGALIAQGTSSNSIVFIERLLLSFIVAPSIVGVLLFYLPPPTKSSPKHIARTLREQLQQSKENDYKSSYFEFL